MNKTQRKPPRPPMQLTCDACGKTFMRAPSKYKAKYNFCSEACAWTAHREAVMGRAERVRILITCSISAPCGSCPEKGCGAKHTTCEAYIAFRKKADKYKRDKQKAMARNASTRGCMRTLHDANRAKREGRQHY